MTRYYFNFRRGDEVSRDRIGMFLPSIDAARAEAIHAWRDLIFIGSQSAELACECEIQIADDSGDTVLSIPFGEQTRLH